MAVGKCRETAQVEGGGLCPEDVSPAGEVGRVDFCGSCRGRAVGLSSAVQGRARSPVPRTPRLVLCPATPAARQRPRPPPRGFPALSPDPQILRS